MFPGVAGNVFAVTLNELVGLEPQVLFALTVIVPEFDPAVTVILLVVDDPVQPVGKVQVYVVAPGTVATE